MSAQRATAVQNILEAPVAPTLLGLAAPNVLAVSMMTAVTFADAWFVGFLGTADLASLALVFPFLTLMQMMAGGSVGGGTTSAVARALGADDVTRAESIAWHAVVLAALMSVVYMLVLGVFSRPIYQLLGGTGAALDGAVLFSAVAFGGAAASWFIWVVAAVYRGMGDTTTPGRVITLASVLQIILAGALTLGWFGLPSLGVTGTAVALVACQGAGALYLSFRLMAGAGRLRLRPHRLCWRDFADILRVAGLGLFNSSCMAMTVAVATGYIGRYGTAALAGFGLGARLELMLVPIAFGVGAALTAAVGVNIGAGQFARARRFAWTGGAATFVLTGLIGLIVAVRPDLWLDLFTADPAAYPYGVSYLVIAGVAYGVFGGGQSLYFASQGTGDVRWPVVVTLIRFVIVVAGGAFLVARDWPVEALFAVVTLGLVISGIGQAMCLRTRAWSGKAGA